MPTAAMPAPSEVLPLTETIAPADPVAIVHTVREAFESGTPVYPIGGGTALDSGLPARDPGIGLSLTGVQRVVDYPARDMTITVEAGVTMQALAATLAAEGQRLPIDCPQADAATLGGVIATNTSGARRYGQGTMRDYVIGISAVDGRGMAFKGGGRVVKNVAGYDFCKLLTGSLGTLGVITQITLKVKPLPEASALVVCGVPNRAAADALLAGLVTSRAAPAAIELLVGPGWSDLIGGSETAYGVLAVGIEGTRAEVTWMQRTLESELRGWANVEPNTLDGDAAATLWRRLAEFPASSDGPLSVKATVLPHNTTELIDAVLAADPQADVQAHAGNGVAVVHFREFPAGGISRILLGKLQPAALHSGGNLTILRGGAGELTRPAVWGGTSESAELMHSVKQQFDPKGILNPGRFVY